MRKLVSGLFISADGVTEAPDQWQGTFDEAMIPWLGEHMTNTDAMVLGRVTYEEWSQYWPNATTDLDFADFINKTPKYVASTTLDSVQWGDYDSVTLMQGNIIDEIKALKAKPGKEISVNGSPTLVRFLLDNDVLDELTLFIHPVVAGKGRRLFQDDGALKRLQVVKSEVTPAGTVIVRYAPSN